MRKTFGEPRETVQLSALLIISQKRSIERLGPKYEQDALPELKFEKHCSAVSPTAKPATAIGEIYTANDLANS